MKIYQSPHTVAQKQKRNYLDIPISYIQKDYYPESIVVDLNSDFAMEIRKPIVPYQEFSSSKFLAFDENSQRQSLELRYQNNKYTYLPDGIEFVPQTFEAKFLLKRKENYLTSTTYRWNVGFMNTPSVSNDILHIISIFGDAARYNMAPKNIEVNDKTNNINDFIINDYDNLDFLFVSNYNENNVTIQSLDFEALFSTPKTIWILFDDTEAQRYFIETTDSYTTTFESEHIPYGQEQTVDKTTYNYRAASSHDIQELLNLGYRDITDEIFFYGNLQPFIVYEKPNSGYIIISPKQVIENSKFNYKIIFNTMMTAYLHGYKISNNISSWITDEPVMRIGTPQNIYNKTHETLLFKDYLDYDDEIYQYDIESAIISNNNVSYVNMNNFKLYFITNEKKDPIIPGNYISMKNHHGSVFCFNQENNLFLIEPHVKIQTLIENNNCYITVFPFVSSSKQIIVDKIHKLKIKDVSKKWYLIILPIQNNDTSDVILMSEDDYDLQSSNSYTIAEITINLKGEISATDIRIMGGGLPLNYTNYDMMNIGVPQGKPYRMGVGGIIKLPKKYEPYDDKIKQAVTTYKVAADMFYIIYTDD